MFDLHSPTLTSLKWWPGGLGHTATHAVVYANLIIKGRNKRVHAFMVALRNLDDHKPLEGIEVGDIGPKLGYNSMDNGFARFTHVKVPREHACRLRPSEGRRHIRKSKTVQRKWRMALCWMCGVVLLAIVPMF